MEASVRDFTALRLREIDRHLRAHFNTTTNGWILRFTKATGVRACEMRVGFLYLVKGKRGRMPKRSQSINLPMVSKLEEWSASAAGFESGWAITRPSRFTTRRKSLLPAEDQRISKAATLSPLEQDEVQWNLRQSSQINGDTESGTINIMSNPDPSLAQSPQCNPQSSDTPPPLPHPTDLGSGLEAGGLEDGGTRQGV